MAAEIFYPVCERIPTPYGEYQLCVFQESEKSKEHLALVLGDVTGSNDVLVVPSSFEGFGIVCLEGMRFGLPGIGTNQGGAKEIIRPDETGYLIEPGDASCLAALLVGLHHVRQSLKAMRINALRQQQQFPGWRRAWRKCAFFAGFGSYWKNEVSARLI